MNTATSIQAGSNAVAVPSRDRAKTAYRSASWSALEITFGCIASGPMAHNGHKTTRHRPLEPSR